MVPRLDGTFTCRMKRLLSLLEPHERPHAHAACQQHSHPVLGEMTHRRHAAALLVRNVGNDVDGGDLPVVQRDQGVKLAMPEVGAHNGIQAPGKFGRYGNDGAHVLSSNFNSISHRTFASKQTKGLQPIPQPPFLLSKSTFISRR